MKSSAQPLYVVLSWIVSILVPAALAVGIIRLMLTPLYLQVEYHTPNFPPDPFGFTLQQRLHYGGLAVAYLTNNSGISFLGDLHFPPGQEMPPTSCEAGMDCTKLFNSRELQHMVDVKNTVKGALLVWYISLAGLVLLGILAWQMNWIPEYLRGLWRGGWLTIIVLGIIIIGVLIAFNFLFILFHEIFFQPGTWTFLESDTLIRLFPERFWRDTFLWVGGLTVFLSLLLIYISGRIQKALYLR